MNHDFALGMVTGAGLVAALWLICGCASPRYDAQGNGTWLIDKIERGAIHSVNNEHY